MDVMMIPFPQMDTKFHRKSRSGFARHTYPHTEKVAESNFHNFQLDTRIICMFFLECGCWCVCVRVFVVGAAAFLAGKG